VDTATQALLGAVVGQAGFSHKLGRRALGWGALGGLLPDLDVLANLTHGPFGEFLHHRGLSCCAAGSDSSSSPSSRTR
jgi:inner membrane protein